MESRTPFLSLRNFSIVREGRVILHPLDLNLYSGESVCVLGSNGSGKSTLLEALACVAPAPEGGALLLQGKPMAPARSTPREAWSTEARARVVSYLPQRIDVPLDFTVEEIVRFGRAPYAGTEGACDDNAKVETALLRWELTAMRARKVQALSGGERQRAHLARIDAQNTPGVILDEPTSSLDLRVSQLLYQALQASADRLFIYATHDLVQGPNVATRILLMHQGRVLADGPWSAIEVRFEEAFGVSPNAIRGEGKPRADR
jgi:iron complex transport system ATP-binding protein